MRLFTVTFAPADPLEGAYIFAATLAEAQTLAATVTTDVPGATFLMSLSDVDVTLNANAGVILTTYRLQPADPIDWDFIPTGYQYAFMQPDNTWYVSDTLPSFYLSRWEVASPGNVLQIPLTGFSSTARNSLYRRP